MALIYCTKLGKESEQLDTPPLPGNLGKRIYNEISQEAWDMWLTQQTMLINENHLVLTNPDARTFLRENMVNFLFGDNYKAPEGFIDPK